MKEKIMKSCTINQKYEFIYKNLPVKITKSFLSDPVNKYKRLCANEVLNNSTQQYSFSLQRKYHDAILFVVNRLYERLREVRPRFSA